MNVDVEPIVVVDCAVGEGPVWDAQAKALWWVDIPAGQVHRLDTATAAHETWSAAGLVSAIALRSGGGLLLATPDGFATYSPGAELRPVANLPMDVDGVTTRLNDGACDPAGRFWAGSMALDPTVSPGRGSLYRLDPDYKASRVLGGLSLSNGIDWSPDGAVMYLIDTLAYGVDAFDFDVDEGRLGKRRRLVDLPNPGPGFVAPDGMTVDADGCMWVAMWGGSSVRRFAPDGRPLGDVRLPVTQVTSCAFGGEDLGDLYITTAADGVSPESEPLAGSLFHCRPGVVGRPPHRFAG